MSSPCVSALHDFVEKHVAQGNTDTLDVARLAELEVAVPPVSALLLEDINQLASDSLLLWNQAVKGEKDGPQQQLQSLSSKNTHTKRAFSCFTIPIDVAAALISQKCRRADAHAMRPKGTSSKT